jgi:uncharacterized protein involved in exopolysaccharide biosynthesis
MQLQALNESMNRARERRILFERQLKDIEIDVAVAAPVVPTTAGAVTPPMTAAQQLEAAKARLELYRGHYTADHPDMKTLERSIRDLEAKVAFEAKSGGTAQPARLLTPAEALRQKRMADVKAELEVIDHQLAASLTEAKRLQAEIESLQAKVATLPTRESELTELTRDYDTLKATYNSLRTKQEDAKLAANLQRRQAGEQFNILDAASLPERPFNQIQRMLMTFSGAVFGLLLGFGFVCVREYRDSSFKTEDDVLRVLSLPVLAQVPMMQAPSTGRGWWRKKGAAAAVSVVLVALAAAVVFWGRQA